MIVDAEEFEDWMMETDCFTVGRKGGRYWLFWPTDPETTAEDVVAICDALDEMGAS